MSAEEFGDLGETVRNIRNRPQAGERKAREEIIAERERLGREFEERHSDFLTALRQMPKGSREEKEQRWDFFQSYLQREIFLIDLMDVYKPGIAAKYESRRNMNGNHSPDWDLASFRNRGVFDSCVFMETVQESIFNFTGFKKDGSSYGFLACIGTIYGQKAGRAAANNELGRLGISDTGIPEKERLSIMKLAQKVNDICACSPHTGSPEDVLDRLLKERRTHYTKRESELARRLIFKRGIVSLDERYEDEDGNGMSLMEKIEDGKADISDIEGIPFLETFCRHVEENWETIAAGITLKKQEYIRIFFTKDILSILKLDGNGKPYPREPAGNREIYQSLEPCGATLYKKVFCEKYLWRAFIERPGDFYEVYVKLLRNDFDFSHKIIAQVLGKDKTSVSRGGKAYREVMKAFYAYYINSI